MDVDDQVIRREVPLRTLLLEVFGIVLLAVGIVGVFIPLVPTTPLIIAAAFCLASNPRIHRFIMDSPFLGDYVRAWNDDRSLPLKSRVQGIVMVWATLVVTMAFLMTDDWQRALLTLVGVCVTVHLMTVFRGHRSE